MIALARMLTCFLVALTLLATLSGCHTLSTYPPVSGVDELVRPSSAPIPSLMAEAIAFSHQRYGPDKPLRINLPKGTPAAVYEQVIRKIGEGEPLREAGKPAYHVTEVRIRGFDAEVDIFHPRTEYEHELVTIRFRRGLFEPFHVKSTRQWRIRVDVPEPHYVPPIDEMPATQSEAEPAPAPNPDADAPSQDAAAPE